MKMRARRKYWTPPKGPRFKKVGNVAILHERKKAARLFSPTRPSKQPERVSSAEEFQSHQQNQVSSGTQDSAK